MRCCLYRKHAESFLSLLAEKEIADSTKDETLFRGNSLATKCIDQYMKIIGLAYLKKVVKPLIDRVFSEAKDCEIDPTKVSCLKASFPCDLRVAGKQISGLLILFCCHLPHASDKREEGRTGRGIDREARCDSDRVSFYSSRGYFYLGQRVREGRKNFTSSLCLGPWPDVCMISPPFLGVEWIGPEATCLPSCDC